MFIIIRNISRKCIETLEALTDKTLMIVLRSPELKQNFLQTISSIYIYIYIYIIYMYIYFVNVKDCIVVKKY